MDDEQLRLAVYEAFANDGRVPGREALAEQLRVTENEVEDGLGRLHERRHVVLGDDGAIVMAHPFASVPLGFSVMGPSTLWWGGCCWDSFALPHLVPDAPEVLVATTCPGCGTALAWVVNNNEPPQGDEVAHFLVPAVRIWDDVVHTCAHQRLFCSTTCIDAWLEQTSNEKGYVMDLPTLWRLASRWYEGRLEYGYTRREPAEAKDYFRSVGLEGEFWGLQRSADR